jgi:hypothetical protein
VVVLEVAHDRVTDPEVARQVRHAALTSRTDLALGADGARAKDLQDRIRRRGIDENASNETVYVPGTVQVTVVDVPECMESVSSPSDVHGKGR